MMLFGSLGRAPCLESWLPTPWSVRIASRVLRLAEEAGNRAALCLPLSQFSDMFQAMVDFHAVSDAFVSNRPSESQALFIRLLSIESWTVSDNAFAA